LTDTRRCSNKECTFGRKKYKNKDYKKWKIKVSGAGADTLLCGEGWHQHQPFRHCQTKAGGVVQVLCG